MHRPGDRRPACGPARRRRAGVGRAVRARVIRAAAAGAAGAAAGAAGAAGAGAGPGGQEGGDVAAVEDGGEDGLAELVDGAGRAAGLEPPGLGGEAGVGAGGVGGGHLPGGQGAVARGLLPPVHGGVAAAPLPAPPRGVGVIGLDLAAQRAAQLGGGHLPGAGQHPAGDLPRRLVVAAGELVGEHHRPGPVNHPGRQRGADLGEALQVAADVHQPRRGPPGQGQRGGDFPGDVLDQVLVLPLPGLRGAAAAQRDHRLGLLRRSPRRHPLGAHRKPISSLSPRPGQTGPVPGRIRDEPGQHRTRRQPVQHPARREPRPPPPAPTMQEPRRDRLTRTRPRHPRNSVVLVGRRVVRTERVPRPRLIEIVGIVVHQEGARIERLIVERAVVLAAVAGRLSWHPRHLRPR